MSDSPTSISDQLASFVEENGPYARWERSHKEVRLHRAAAFDKIAIFNAATIALTANAILGPIHGKITHRYTLRAALCCFVLGMCVSMIRNLTWTMSENHAVMMGLSLQLRDAPEAVKTAKDYTYSVRYAVGCEIVALAATALGLTLLLIVVWPLI